MVGCAILEGEEGVGGGARGPGFVLCVPCLLASARLIADAERKRGFFSGPMEA